jgi:hypothetical protein
MPPEIFSRVVDGFRDRLPDRAGLKSRLLHEVTTCADAFDGTLHVNGLTIGKLENAGEYFVEIREYRYPPPQCGEKQKIDEGRFSYTDRLVVKGDRVTMHRISSDQVSSYKSVSREKVESIIYMLGTAKHFRSR